MIITSDLSFTEAIMLPNHLILLSNPLKVKKIKYEAECEDRNIYKLLNKSKNTSVFTTFFISSPSSPTSVFTMSSFISSSSTHTSTKKDERTTKKLKLKTEKLDVGYIIPLNVDESIKELKDLIQDNDYYKIKSKNKNNNNNNYLNKKYKNYIIYQLVNNKLYVLVQVIKNDFDVEVKNKLFKKITKNLNYISKNFEDVIKMKLKPNNKCNTNVISEGCWTMVRHNKIILTIYERYYYIAKIIQQYIQDNNLYDFANISNKNIDNIDEYFKNHNEFNMIIKINILQF